MRKRFWQTFNARLRAGVTVALIALFVLIGALTLYAAAGSHNTAGALPASLTSARHGAALDVPTPTNTDIPATPTAVPPTDTPLPAPTDTPVPLVPVTFTCASGQTSEPGAVRLNVCITSQPGSQVNLDASYCGALSTESIAPLDGSGTWSTDAWMLSTTCTLPFTVTITARGTSGDGRPLTGSTSLVVSQ